MPDYPKREKFFAHKAVRLMIKTCVAQEIGPVGFSLLVVIAHTEDAAHYRRPVTWYDSQLIPVIGVQSRKSVMLARRKAIEAGWLHYEAGHRGRASRYWITVPDHASGLDDLPSDEGDPDFVSRSGTESGQIGTFQGTESGQIGTFQGTESGQIGTFQGYTSYPNPIPGTLPALPKGSARSYSESFEVWWSIYPRKQAKKKAAAKYPVAIKHIAANRACTPEEAEAWLLDRTRLFAASDKAKGEFCPYPTTWLEQGRYDDDDAAWSEYQDDDPMAPLKPGQRQRIPSAEELKHWNPQTGIPPRSQWKE